MLMDCLIEGDPDEQQERDARPARDEEPGHVGLGRAVRVPVPGRNCLECAHHHHEDEDGEAEQVEDTATHHLPLLSVRHEARAPRRAPLALRPAHRAPALCLSEIEIKVR